MPKRACLTKRMEARYSEKVELLKRDLESARFVAITSHDITEYLTKQ